MSPSALRRRLAQAVSRGRALLASEYRLIILPIGIVGFSFAGDVGWKRHFSRALQQQFHRLFAVKMEEDRARLVPPDGAGMHACTEIDQVAVADSLRVAHKGPPAAQVLTLVQGCADAGFTAPALQLSGNNARVIEDQRCTIR